MDDDTKKAKFKDSQIYGIDELLEFCDDVPKFLVVHYPKVQHFEFDREYQKRNPGSRGTNGIYIEGFQTDSELRAVSEGWLEHTVRNDCTGDTCKYEPTGFVNLCKRNRRTSITKGRSKLASVLLGSDFAKCLQEGYFKNILPRTAGESIILPNSPELKAGSAHYGIDLFKLYQYLNNLSIWAVEHINIDRFATQGGMWAKRKDQNTSIYFKTNNGNKFNVTYRSENTDDADTDYEYRAGQNIGYLIEIIESFLIENNAGIT